jgi:hypothetical protein
VALPRVRQLRLFDAGPPTEGESSIVKSHPLTFRQVTTSLVCANTVQPAARADFELDPQAVPAQQFLAGFDTMEVLLVSKVKPFNIPPVVTTGLETYEIQTAQHDGAR